MLWYSVFSFLIFCLKSTIRKDIWMKTTFTIVMVIFLKCHSESYLIIAILKFVLNIYEPHWQEHFERHLKVENFINMDQDSDNSFLSNYHETKIDTQELWRTQSIIKKRKVPWRLSVAQESEPLFHKTLHQHIEDQNSLVFIHTFLFSKHNFKI